MATTELGYSPTYRFRIRCDSCIMTSCIGSGEMNRGAFGYICRPSPVAHLVTSLLVVLWITFGPGHQCRISIWQATLDPLIMYHLFPQRRPSRSVNELHKRLVKLYTMAKSMPYVACIRRRHRCQFGKTWKSLFTPPTTSFEPMATSNTCMYCLRA